MDDDGLAARFGAAEAVARAAGARALALFREPRALRVTRKGRQDFVSQADHQVEALIRERVAEAFPGDGFLGEEGGGATEVGAGAGLWVVDPIDGTSNFVSGLPVWCVSIAYLAAGRIELGVIYDPNLDELYAGRRGRGASLNGRPIRVSPAGSLADGNVAIGYSARTEAAPALAAIERLIAAEGNYQRNGSAALSLAQVAAGRLLGFCEAHMNSWDCLAGILLVEEAGGRSSDFLAGQGLARGNPLVAAAPAVFDALVAVAGY